MEVLLPCSLCPSPAWGYGLGCLHPCSSGHLDEAKPMLYPEIIFSQANMLCSAFPCAGHLPLSSGYLCLQSLDEKGHRWDAAASPSPAACPKPPACFHHLGSLLSVNVASNSGSWLPFPLNSPGLVHEITQAPEISFLGHVPNSRLYAWDCLPQQQTRANFPPSASYQPQAPALSQVSVQLLLAPESVGPCQPWGLRLTHSLYGAVNHSGEGIPRRRQPRAGGERLVRVQYRGAVRQLIRPSTVLPLKSISRVLANCSLFGITDVSRAGERQQEAPERRICALTGVGE